MVDNYFMRFGIFNVITNHVTSYIIIRTIIVYIRIFNYSSRYDMYSSRQSFFIIIYV